MRIRSWSWCAPLFVILAACGSKQSRPPSEVAAPPLAAEQPASGGRCPMMPPAGTQVVTSDTSDGVAVAFTTTGDVAALRAHVRHMADMHNRMSGMHHGSGMHEGMGSGGMHGGMGSAGMSMQMIPSRASVEDIPGGARLVLVPDDPAQLSALRTHVREHAAMMAAGQCPMMGTQPQPTDEPTQHQPPGT